MYTRYKQTTIKIKQEIKQLNMETARQWNTKRQKKTQRQDWRNRMETTTVKNSKVNTNPNIEPQT